MQILNLSKRDMQFKCDFLRRPISLWQTLDDISFRLNLKEKPLFGKDADFPFNNEILSSFSASFFSLTFERLPSAVKPRHGHIWRIQP